MWLHVFDVQRLPHSARLVGVRRAGGRWELVSVAAAGCGWVVEALERALERGRLLGLLLELRRGEARALRGEPGVEVRRFVEAVEGGRVEAGYGRALLRASVLFAGAGPRPLAVVEVGGRRYRLLYSRASHWIGLAARPSPAPEWWDAVLLVAASARCPGLELRRGAVEEVLARDQGAGLLVVSAMLPLGPPAPTASAARRRGPQLAPLCAPLLAPLLPALLAPLPPSP